MKRDPMCDSEQLVSYLYGECEAGERAAVERHLAACRDCSDEVASLQGVRLDLQSWAPPDVALDIRVGEHGSPHSSPEPRPPFWSRPLGRGPQGGSRAGVAVWAQMAAAVVILAAGAAIAHIEVRYGSEGFTIRTGWSSAPDATTEQRAARFPAVVNTTANAPWRTEMAALERQLRSEIRAASLQGPRGDTTSVATKRDAPADQAELLRRTRAWIETSEEKQRRELALQIANVMRDMNVQRVTDLTRIADGLGLIENRTGAVVAEQQKTINALVVRASQTR